MEAFAAAFLRFCLVGVVGFVIDAGLTLAFTQLLRVSPMPARVVAFVFAATATWALNRSYTFRSTAGGRSWMHYVLATGIGALINIGVYWAWLSVVGPGPLAILGGVALGSIAALGFNFVASRAIFAR